MSFELPSAAPNLDSTLGKAHDSRNQNSKLFK